MARQWLPVEMEDLLPEVSEAGALPVAQYAVPCLRIYFREITKVVWKDTASRIFNMMLFIASKYFVSI